MKPIAALSTILLAAYCSAAELNPNLLRLIPADARFVSGADIDRQANSALNVSLYQISIPTRVREQPIRSYGLATERPMPPKVPALLPP
jgi:hypothetical protein